MSDRSSHIGTLSEKSLHSQLKKWSALPGDEFEASVDGFVVDIQRGDELIEIQTGNFAKIKRKLLNLIQHHRVRLVFPIPREKWIVRQSTEGEYIGRRRSPKRGNILDMFTELVYIPPCLTNRNFSLQVLITQEEEIRRGDGQGSWRRGGWSIFDRRLLDVYESHIFSDIQDYTQFLPAALPQLFTNRDLANSLKCKIAQARKVTYTLRHAGIIQFHGKKGNANLYTYHR